jgi:hypothetical protein
LSTDNPHHAPLFICFIDGFSKRQSCRFQNGTSKSRELVVLTVAQ